MFLFETKIVGRFGEYMQDLWKDNFEIIRYNRGRFQVSTFLTWVYHPMQLEHVKISNLKGVGSHFFCNDGATISYILLLMIAPNHSYFVAVEIEIEIFFKNVNKSEN